MEEFNKKEYQEFLEKHEKGHYAQSLEWANVKDEWKNEIIIVRDNSGKINSTNYGNYDNSTFAIPKGTLYTKHIYLTK